MLRYFLPLNLFAITLAFDAKRLFTNFTGLGNYSRTLVQNLAATAPEHDYLLATPKLRENEETAPFLNNPAFTVLQPNRWHRRPLWRSRGVVRDLQRHGTDIYHGLSHELPMGIERTGIRTVVTMHDLIFHFYPAQYRLIDRTIYARKFRSACRRADAVIAISESTKQDIMRIYGTPPERIHVIYQGCDPRFERQWATAELADLRTRLELPQDFFLYVGSLIERKNLHGIIAALALLPPADRRPLVIVGGGGAAYRARCAGAARAAGVEELLRFRRPTFADLPGVYQSARLFLYPSYYEGFGIPVVEALLSGCPVITSDTSSLPEAAGPDSLLVPPTEPAAIAGAISRILHEPGLAERMVVRGKNYAERFSAPAVTEPVLGTLRKLPS